MSLRTFIRARKTIVEPGAWSDKRMPKTGGTFPLTKARKSFRVGAPGWRWRVVTLSASGQTYRLLVMYHAAKENYYAILGLVTSGDMLVVGKLEYHSTHRGWHVHSCCKELDMANAGRMKYQDMSRYPRDGKGHHRSQAFGVDGDVAALEKAAHHFRIPDLKDPGGTQLAIAYAQP
jgi:hypothetical protein